MRWDYLAKSLKGRSYMSALAPASQAFLDSERIPWIPLGPGESFKPLRFLPNDGRILLLRLEPGTVVPTHRHLGEVHAFNLAGSRKLHTGEVVGPGGYVYEPAGNVDSWTAVGAEPVIVHITVYGAMEYLGPGGTVVQRDSTASLRERYLRFCAENQVEIGRAHV